ncbi:MAG: ribosome maturation factor RimP [Syntrophomonadaceae bacterium]|nr:ribosome maturation factor RimP [Syntrophomonadaceae bacterium]
MAKLKAREIEELLLPIFADLQVELVDIEYRLEDKAQMLRIFIDHVNGIDLEICTDVTKVIKKFLDDEDIHYEQLEVSSPGLNRIIKKHHDTSRFIGKQVKVKTMKSYEGPRNITGILNNISDENINIVNDDNNYLIPWDVVSNLRLHPDFK